VKTFSKYIPYIVIAILLLFMHRSCEKQEELANAYTAAADTLSITRNKLGQEVAEKQLIQTESKKAFLQMTAANEEIAELQREVKKLKGRNVSATILTNNTTNTLNTATDSIIIHDTIYENGTITVFPTYTYARNNEWERFDIRASKDSLQMDYEIYNKFVITQSMKKQGGFFSKKAPTISVTNQNPYTTTQQLQSYSVDCKCRKGMWFSVGTAAGATGIVVLLNSIK
jgi:hypothetical protein